MMSRTQVYLDRELLRRARNRAGELGISLAEYIRRLVSRDLEELGQAIDPSSIFNLGNSGGSDVAAQKRDLLGAAGLAEQRRGEDRR